MGVLFECCNICHRIYINKEENAFEGKSPKCRSGVIARIDQGGRRPGFLGRDKECCLTLI